MFLPLLLAARLPVLPAAFCLTLHCTVAICCHACPTAALCFVLPLPASLCLCCLHVPRRWQTSSDDSAARHTLHLTKLVCTDLAVPAVALSDLHCMCCRLRLWLVFFCCRAWCAFLACILRLHVCILSLLHTGGYGQQRQQESSVLQNLLGSYGGDD
jgi:hypothetical protein